MKKSKSLDFYPVRRQLQQIFWEAPHICPSHLPMGNIPPTVNQHPIPVMNLELHAHYKRNNDKNYGLNISKPLNFKKEN